MISLNTGTAALFLLLTIAFQHDSAHGFLPTSLPSRGCSVLVHDPALHASTIVDQDEAVDYLRVTAVNSRKEKQMTKAIQAYDTLLEFAPLDPEATYQRADTLAQMGYIDEAVAGFEQSIELLGVNGDGRPTSQEISLANVLLDGKGEVEQALEIFQRAGPESPLVMVAGVCLDSLGRHDEAKECYQHALSQMGGDADFMTMVYLCICRFRQQQQNLLLDAETDEMNSMMKRMEQSPLNFFASSWQYIATNTPPSVWNSPSVHYFTYDMVQLAMENTMSQGLILEFGVYYGKTIRMMADYFNKDTTIHGFDTFEGLPGDWFFTKKGSYSTDGNIPLAPDNVQFHKGLFSETLPGFLAQQPSNTPIRLMNIDCDMYASTKDVFDLVYDRIVPGTIILFDEYVGNPHWKEDEYKAFQEAVQQHGWKYEYLAISMASQQAIVRIL